jgi:hypothetical protein
MTAEDPVPGVRLSAGAGSPGSRRPAQTLPAPSQSMDRDKYVGAVAVGPMSSLVMPVSVVVMMPVRMVPVVFMNYDSFRFGAF